MAPPTSTGRSAVDRWGGSQWTPHETTLKVEKWKEPLDGTHVHRLSRWFDAVSLVNPPHLSTVDRPGDLTWEVRSCWPQRL